MSTRPLTAWLRELSARDALLAAWRSAPDAPIATYETDALAIAARGAKTRTSVTVATPSGRGRLPLLAAVHAAALRLTGFPSPFSGREYGPVALVTRQVIRRAELAEVDAAGALVSPALHPARLRADGLLAPLPSGRPVPQGPSHLLILVGPSAGWVTPALPPSTVIVDAVDEDREFVAGAIEWATGLGATRIMFDDVVRRVWLPGDVFYPCGWSAIMADEPRAGDSLTALAPVRGHAVALAAGARADLAAAAVILADARRRGPLPPALVEASVLWRRLDELVVPLDSYDAACPRWHTPTLTERLEDLALVRASDFPRGWRTWAQTCWAGVKEGLAAACAALMTSNVKAELLLEAVDADLRAGLAVDVALPSRTARDALTRHLAEAGVPIPVDGRLILRSLADADAWGPPRATLLPAPPGTALRHRLVGADIGPLNILCYDHEVSPLERRLRDVLDEPLTVQGPVRQLLPPAVDLSVDVHARRPKVVVSLSTPFRHGNQSGVALSHLADAIEIAGLSALRTAGQRSTHPDLPEADSDDVPAGSTTDHQGPQGLVAAVPLTVASAGSEPSVVIYVPAQGTVARVLDSTVRRIPALEVSPGMLVTALDGVTPFDRLRPLLLEARGPVTRMLLTAWDQALTMALRGTGGPTALARALTHDGATVATAAVAAWADDERIGPRDAENVTRVGKLARHPVVADNGSAIADVMKGLRLLHQAVGRALAKPLGVSQDVAGELERLLGSDAVSMVAETVVYRVVAVGEVITVNRNALYGDLPLANGAGGDAQKDEEQSDDR